MSHNKDFFYLNESQQQHNNFFHSVSNMGNGKNLLRIVKSENIYNNYPWPKYLSMDKDNILINFKENKFGDTLILTPINGYCMYINKICSHYGISQNLKVIKKYNYLIFN